MAWSAPLYRVYERRLLDSLSPDRLPSHLGVILDGHRRFARAEGLSDYTTSYRSGMAKLGELLEWSAQRRPREELDPYFDVLIELLDDLPRLAARLGCSVRVIGSLELLPERLSDAAARAEAAGTGTAASWHFNLALGYGGRDEIVDACKSLVAKLAAEGLSASEIADHIDAAGLSTHVYTADLPDPDLVIRTSGEARLSGFLLWQAAYAECVFVDPYWPEFRRVDFLRALRDFARRERRFGR
jgi:short-chain Z-isoprenyl diphosphate synthase